MPLIHTSRFKVRYYECDLYGHVNNTNYLRYMQEAAFEASAAAGYDAARYEQMNRAWYVRATDVDYIRPLKFDDEIEIKTWIADFRRVTSRRAYELRLVATGELVGKGSTDWAFVDRTTERPAPIPDSLLQDFFPEGLPAEQAEREKFPTAPPPPPGAFRVRHRVQWRELDPTGHVNNAIYAEWGEDGGMQCIAHYKWPAARMAEAGLGIFYRRMWIEHVQAARQDDEVEITAWLSDMKRVTAMRHFLITRVADGATLAKINILGVCANITTGAPTRIRPRWPTISVRILHDTGKLLVPAIPFRRYT